MLGGTIPQNLLLNVRNKQTYKLKQKVVLQNTTLVNKDHQCITVKSFRLRLFIFAQCWLFDRCQMVAALFINEK